MPGFSNLQHCFILGIHLYLYLIQLFVWSLIPGYSIMPCIEKHERLFQEIIELFLLLVVWVTGSPSRLESSLESLGSDSWLLTIGKKKPHCWYLAAFDSLAVL